MFPDPLIQTHKMVHFGHGQLPSWSLGVELTTCYKIAAISTTDKMFKFRYRYLTEQFWCKKAFKIQSVRANGIRA